MTQTSEGNTAERKAAERKEAGSRRCLIITSHIDQADQITVDPEEYDAVIAADGGLIQAEELGIRPDILIGDYDSCELPEGRDAVVLPAEKDMTDSEAALDLAYERGFRRAVILGGLGGRFDHTMGNIGLLAKYCGKMEELAFVDGINRVTMKAPGSYIIPRDDYYYLGLAAYGGPCAGLSAQGVKYPLDDYTLPDDPTLGVSNELLGREAEITFRGGKLLIIQSRR